MIRAKFDQGRLVAVEIDYMAATREVRAGLHAWVALHDLDPRSIPARVTVEYDADTEEWIFPVFARVGGNGAVKIDPNTREPITYLVRRKAKRNAPAPEAPTRRLIGPLWAHHDAPCTDACYESVEGDDG
jgi:hypothetical protein